MGLTDDSPIHELYGALRTVNPAWGAAIGCLTNGEAGWIPGNDFRTADAGPFANVLERIGVRSATDDRRTIAGSFALHWGWTASIAVAPFVRYGCVPDVSLDNIAVRLSPSANVVDTAVCEPRGTVVAGDPRARHASMTTVADHDALLGTLRAVLVRQSAPVVDALHRWSAFAERAIWGVLASLWASHLIAAWQHPDQRPLVRMLEAFFDGDDMVAEMRPLVTPVASGGAVRLELRRASCCRFYLARGGSLCTSCPIVPEREPRPGFTGAG